MSSWREKADRIVRKVATIASGAEDESIVKAIPKASSEGVGAYTARLWDDARKSYENAFAESKPLKWHKAPRELLKDFARLEGGDDWTVFGRRKELEGETEWVDGELQDQIRARNAYLNGNWHDVTIQPNIQGINEIFDSERKITDWGNHVRLWTRCAQHFGDTWIESYLDRDGDPNGVANEKTLRPLSFFWTPRCFSIKKEEGCYYAVHGEKVTGQWVKKHFPDFALDKTIVASDRSPALIGLETENTLTFAETNYFDKIRVFLDDDSFEAIPFNQEEFDIRVADVVEGKQVFPNAEVDNHKKWIKAYQDWLEERTKFYQDKEDKGELTLEDEAYINQIVDRVDGQIMLHQQNSDQSKVPEEQRIPPGKRRKYPFGRFITTIAGQVVQDEPNPYEFDWRRKFHNLADERIPERIDGRGDVEILYNTEKALSTQLSHMADDELLNGHKPAWLPLAEKAQWEANNQDNDPKKPRWYVQTAPQFPDGQGTKQSAELYTITKENAPHKLGVSAITHGEAPTKSAGHETIEDLISQNETIITGELNANLNDVIEDIVETRIMIWKKFYTNPRNYMIDGEVKELTLSEYLTVEEVQDGQGQTVSKKIPAIIVTVRPNSNFPNKFEGTLSLFSKLASIADQATGQQLIPFTAFQDLMSERFPGFAKGGKYRQDSQALAIGQQVMKQQQEQQLTQQKDKQKLIDAAHAKARSAIINEAIPASSGNNGGMQANG